MLPRLKHMHPLTHVTGIMNMGKAYSTAILQATPGVVKKGYQYTQLLHVEHLGTN